MDSWIRGQWRWWSLHTSCIGEFLLQESGCLMRRVRGDRSSHIAYPSSAPFFLIWGKLNGWRLQGWRVKVKGEGWRVKGERWKMKDERWKVKGDITVKPCTPQHLCRHLALRNDVHNVSCIRYYTVWCAAHNWIPSSVSRNVSCSCYSCFDPKYGREPVCIPDPRVPTWWSLLALHAPTVLCTPYVSLQKRLSYLESCEVEAIL